MSDDGWPADPDGLDEVDEDVQGLAQDGPGAAKDDAEDDDTEPEHSERPWAAQASPRQAWEIILAERDEAGEWRTVGEPVPDAHFTAQDLAHDFAEKRNHVMFRGFDWLNEPVRAWVAVRVGQRGRL